MGHVQIQQLLLEADIYQWNELLHDQKYMQNHGKWELSDSVVGTWKMVNLVIYF